MWLPLPLVPLPLLLLVHCAAACVRAAEGALFGCSLAAAAAKLLEKERAKRKPGRRITFAGGDELAPLMKDNHGALCGRRAVRGSSACCAAWGLLHGARAAQPAQPPARASLRTSGGRVH